VSDTIPPDSPQGLADEVISAFARLARADFSVRLPRSYKKDNADIVAMFVNVIAEELDRLWKARQREQQELQRGVERLTEAFVAFAAGDFAARAPRSGKGDPLDVLAGLLNKTTAEVGAAFTEVASQRAMVEAILDSMVDGVLSLDVEGRVRRANRTVAGLLGWSQPADMVGLSIHELLAPRDSALATELARIGEGSVRARDILFSMKSGASIALTVNASPVRGAGGPLEGVVVIVRDERQLKKTQAQLQLADRLATMGTLAAGVAHEINNPLAFVTSNIDYVSDALEQSAGGPLERDQYDDMMKALRASQGGAERVRLIVRDLRAFSRVEHETTARLDLRKLLDSAANMIRNEVRHHAQLTRDYGPVPFVDANEPRLVQVLLNLIQNAAHAIHAGDAGKNEIRLVTRTSDEGEAIVEVHDTGTGIADEHLPYIFDAFFTTKAVGVGTGLGLAICQKIVTSFGGRIEVETEVGCGSTFRVALPPSTSQVAEPVVRKRSLPSSARASTRRRVLVVDDEPEVGDAFQRLLGAAHDVVVVTSGAQALQHLRASAFDVVFCDLMMPEITGMDLFRRLLREMPEVTDRVVFMTGGTFGSGVEEFLASIGNERIDKPFDRAVVVSLVETT
jgi:PAS domain S-box-containing protein